MTEGIQDKRGFLAAARAGGGAVLELGCGARKQIEGAIAIDLLESDAVDIVGDACEVLRGFPDGSVARIYSFHFFEHVPDVEALLRETSRVLQDGGTMEVTVPHFSNPYFYSDPTHRSYFGLYTFSYYAEENLLVRKVPKYGKSFGFELREVDLGFKSPFAVRNLFKRVVGAVVNATTGLKEFYEENLAYLVPCYEVRYLLARVPRSP